MKVVLVHGYNDDGTTTWLHLLPYLARNRIDAILYAYPLIGGGRWNGPVTGLIGARCLNRRRARHLARLIRQSGARRVIAHSNGCALAHYAGEETRIDVLVALHPALDRGLVFSRKIQKVYVYHDEGDAPVRWSRFLLGHVWGAMGAWGAQKDLSRDGGRVTNVAYDADEGYGIDEHSEILRRHWMSRVGHQIAQQVKS